MFSRFFRSNKSKPTDSERDVAKQIVSLLNEQVFVGPNEGELNLTGSTEKDAVPMFLWLHAKARDVTAPFAANNVQMSERLRTAIASLHHNAARTAELLAPPVSTMDEVAAENQQELADCMKGFLQQMTCLGNVAQGKRWP